MSGKNNFIAYQNLLFVVLFTCVSMQSLGAQESWIEGRWEGKITYALKKASLTLPFVLVLNMEGSKIRGRTYIFHGDTLIVSSDVVGRLYEDLSMRLQEVNTVASAGVDPGIHLFTRRYQLIVKRDWEISIEGFWQEQINEPLYKKRRLGRVKLVRAHKDKA